MGDVILVIEPDVPRRHWKLGRIEAVYPGRDGLVRVVDVRTGGVVKRRSRRGKMLKIICFFTRCRKLRAT